MTHEADAAPPLSIDAAVLERARRDPRWERVWQRLFDLTMEELSTQDAPNAPASERASG